MSFKALSEYSRRQAIDAGPTVYLSTEVVFRYYTNTYSSDLPLSMDDMASIVFKDIKKWMSESSIGMHEIYHPSPFDIKVGFANKRDAVKFKLAWGGK